MDGTTTTTTTTPEHGGTARPVTSTNFICTSCRESFGDGQAQRAHMAQPWHVYNLKRRIASLAPLSREVFESKIGKAGTETSRDAPDENSGDAQSSTDCSSENDDDEATKLPLQCLFCNANFSAAEGSLLANLEHMRVEHFFEVPDQDRLFDLHTFVQYLSTEVRIWHECLYCGATKPSIASVQSHMRDKQHCRLNLDREPELLDFWEEKACNDEVDGEPVAKRSCTEEFTASSSSLSGVANSRPDSMASANMALITAALSELSHTELAPTADLPQLPRGKQLTRREELSLLGITMQQRTALMIAEQKAQRGEAIASRTREWVRARGANKQKYDQVDTKMKMGKQNHKLFPR